MGLRQQTELKLTAKLWLLYASVGIGLLILLAALIALFNVFGGYWGLGIVVWIVVLGTGVAARIVAHKRSEYRY